MVKVWLCLSYVMSVIAGALVWLSGPAVYFVPTATGAAGLILLFTLLALIALLMDMRGGLKGAGRRLRLLGGDERGSVAVIVGVTLLMLTVCAAFAIDLSRLTAAKRTLQESLDAGTLAAANTDAASMDVVGKATMDAVFSDSTFVKPSVTFEEAEDEVVGTASATVEPFFIGLPLKGPFSVQAHTKVKRAINESLEVALVLDTTYSMTGTKIDTLKKAGKDLVQKIKKDPKADVKIAVIPFGQYVNIGVSRRNQPWVGIGADYSTVTPGKCTEKTISSETVCKKSVKTTCTSVVDGVTVTSSCNKCVESETKTYKPPKVVETCTKDSTKTYKFSGCIGSPAYPKNVEDKDTYRVYPGYMNMTCGSEITPLTSNQGAAISAISTLKPDGETYIPAGMAWGLNALSNVTPLTEGAAYDLKGPNKQPRKVIVLMTDGENTKLMRHSNGKHDLGSPAKGQSATEANDYTAKLCANAKAQKIEIYTVAFQVNDAAAKTMLETCASDGGHYFDASDPDKLLAAFAAIAESLKNLYIAE